MLDKVLMKSVGILITNRIQERIRKNQIVPPTNKSGKSTLVDSGRLMKSIKFRVSGNTIIIGSNVAYAKIHHEGGIIYPKKAKYLTIPLCPEAKGKSARDFTDTYIAKGIIFRKLGKDQDEKKDEALYKLQKSVKIPARPYMFLDSRDKSFIQETIIDYFEEKIRREHGIQ